MVLTDFVAKPFRRFYDLRREVNRRLVEHGNVLPRAKMDGDVRAPDISPAEDARLTEAQVVLRG